MIPLSFFLKAFLAQMVSVCYGLWLQRFHVSLDVAAAHCEDKHLLSRQPADVQLRGCKVHRYCRVAGLAGDTCALNSQVPSWRHMPTLLAAGPDKTLLLLSHLKAKREERQAVRRYFNESRRGDLLCIGS